ncbi:MAG: sensor histidine kinase [Gaiellaceae bacterium]
MRIRPGSLRAQLFAAIGTVVVLSIGITFALGAVLTRQAVDEATLNDLIHQADLLAGREQQAVVPLANLPAMRPYLQRQGERVRVIDRLDRPSGSLSEATRVLLRRGRDVNGSISIGGSDYFFAARPFQKRAFVLLRPHQSVSSAWRPFLRAMAVAALAGMLLAAVAALVLARPIARPLRRVAVASRRLVTRGLEEPLPLEGPSEVRWLAASFNEMAAQLNRARAAERQFLLSVSHELKTPLTAVRGYAEGVAEGALEPAEAMETVLREAERLERLVGDLLDLARMNRSEFSVHPAEIDLAELAREALQRYQAQAEAFGLLLELESQGPAPAFADYDRVLQILSNLLENALRVTPAGGSVRILAAAGTLVVEDTGPGLSADELPRAFERFFLYSRYGGERRVGTGLGLAIVKELAEAMGGSVSVESDPGAGTRLSVRLPAAENAHLPGSYPGRIHV